MHVLLKVTNSSSGGCFPIRDARSHKKKQMGKTDPSHYRPSKVYEMAADISFSIIVYGNRLIYRPSHIFRDLDIYASTLAIESDK